MHQTIPCILSFAACDPTGGAGIQADIMTASALGAHCLTVVTATTVQDSVGVTGVQPVEASWVEAQAKTVLADIKPAAFKIGMIGTRENAEAIAKILADYPQIPVILDPVLASGRGDPFANEELILAIKRTLLPKTTILTPNTIEAQRLSSLPTTNPSIDLCATAQDLITQGCSYVLMTGTHADTRDVINTLSDRNGPIWQGSYQRLPGSYHGSGCTIASAIAALIANGSPVAEAVAKGADYTWETLHHAWPLGRGQLIPNRFFANRNTP